jgi:dihydrofolate synthase/folylpolyglutamate synthase
MDAHGSDQPRFFDATTALAFQIFAAADVDYAVIETGLGGLLDATNTLSRSDKIAVLTTIGLDHTELLGRTVPEIARHKAGILPWDGRAVAVRNSKAGVVDAITAEARRRRCALQLVDVSACLRAATVGPDGTVLRLPGSQDFPLGLHGRHQAGNALLALRVVETLAQRDHWPVDRDALREGLRRASLPGRFEPREWRGLPIIFDGAHNAIKLGIVVATLREMFPARQFPWVLALKHGKDLNAVLEVIAPVASVVVATRFPTAGGDRAGADAIADTTIADVARRVGLSAWAEPEPLVALERATECSTGRQPTVVAGSFQLLSALNNAMAAE